MDRGISCDDFMVVCDKHKQKCMLKTGMKEGASYLKSFFICSLVGAENCNFAKEASNYPAVKCLIHTNEYVELQNVYYSKSANETRKFFRCNVGRSEKKSWCGYVKVQSNTEAAEEMDGSIVSVQKESAENDLKKSTEQSRKSLPDESRKGQASPRKNVLGESNGSSNERSSAVESKSNAHRKSNEQQLSNAHEPKSNAHRKSNEQQMSNAPKLSSVHEPKSSAHRMSNEQQMSNASKMSSSHNSKSNSPAISSTEQPSSASEVNRAASNNITNASSKSGSASATTSKTNTELRPSDLVKSKQIQQALSRHEDMDFSRLRENNEEEISNDVSMINNSTIYRDKSVMIVSDSDDSNSDDSSDDDDDKNKNSNTKGHSKAKSANNSGALFSDESVDLDASEADGLSDLASRLISRSSEVSELLGQNVETAQNKSGSKSNSAENYNSSKSDSSKSEISNKGTDNKTTSSKSESNRQSSDTKASSLAVSEDSKAVPTGEVIVIADDKKSAGLSKAQPQGHSQGLAQGHSQGRAQGHTQGHAQLQPHQGSTVITLTSSMTPSLAGLLNKKQELERQLDTQKKLARSLNPSMLHDGGSRIKQHIVSLSEELEQLNQQISQMSLRADNSTGSCIRPELGKVVQPLRWNQLPTGVTSQSLPQARLVDSQAIKLSDHMMKQMFSADSHSSYLYGGRMTASRLQQVGHVTSDAIELLHKQLETCPAGDQETEDPRGLSVSLMTHQRQALSWMIWREAQQPSGGILADDMGLGKTLTMISLVLARLDCTVITEENKNKTSAATSWLGRELEQVIKSDATLVICPASLVHQWNKEIEKRVKPGTLRVILYHGTSREHSVQKLANADMVLTTYNIISREVGVPEELKKNKNAQDMPATDGGSEQEHDSASSLTLTGGQGEGQQPALLRIAWRRIIMDEAHQIKNHKSLTAMSVCRLRAVHRWALTGTPIHNDLLDMYSLLRFLRCSPFDEYKLWKRQVDNKSEKGTQRLNVLVKSLLLRRTKDQTCLATGKPLVSLPKKFSHVHELQLSTEERNIYERVYAKSKQTMQEYLRQHDERLKNKQFGTSESYDTSAARYPTSVMGASAGSLTAGTAVTAAGTAAAGGGASMGMGEGIKPGPVGSTHILLMLLRLRQCCGHLHLMKNALDVDDVQSDGIDLNLVEQMNELALTDGPMLGGEQSTDTSFDINKPSTKIKALLEELRKIKNGQSKMEGKVSKTVIVSQWTKMLDIIKHHLNDSGFRCCTIRGSVPAKQRAELVESFNTDPNGPEVMLVSLKAGGVGLNLIGGNHLFMIDMHWNPALEHQAYDRIYRVGQKKDVHIHRFICKDTIEEKIVELQNQKTRLAANVLSGAAVADSKLSLNDLRQLFGIGVNPPQPVPAGFQMASSRFMP